MERYSSPSSGAALIEKKNGRKMFGLFNSDWTGRVVSRDTSTSDQCVQRMSRSNGNISSPSKGNLTTWRLQRDFAELWRIG